MVDVEPLDARCGSCFASANIRFVALLARLSENGNSVCPFGSTNFTMPPVSVSQMSPFTALSRRFVPPSSWPLRLFVSR